MIESINREYIELLNSKEMRVGRRFCKFSDALKHGDFSRICGYARTQITKRRVDAIGRPYDLPTLTVVDPEVVNDARAESITLYSCITGCYDVPIPPRYLPQYVNPVLFLDDATIRANPSVSKWDVHRIESSPEMGGNPNRYCKMHPHILFNSEFAVYVDGEIEIVSDLAEWCSIARASKSGLGLFLHSSRGSVYEEEKACLLLKKGTAEAVSAQVARYRAEGLPAKFGLFEATVLVVDLRNENSALLLEAWWREFCRSESGRDQLALPYVLWREGFDASDVGILGTNVWKSPKLRIHNMGGHAADALSNNGGDC